MGAAAHTRNADELHDLLRRAGPLLEGEYDRGFAEHSSASDVLCARDSVTAELLAGARGRRLLRDAFGVVLPGGVPNVLPRPFRTP